MVVAPVVDYGWWTSHVALAKGKGNAVGTCTVPGVDVEEMTVDEGRAMFDALCRDRLGVGREEFLRRLDAGAYDDTDSEDVVRLRIMAPFGR